MLKFEVGHVYKIIEFPQDDMPIYVKVKDVEETIEGTHVYFHLLYTKREDITTDFSVLTKHLTPEHHIKIQEADISEVTLEMLGE